MSVRRLNLTAPLARVTVEVEPSTVCVSIHGELDLASCDLLDAVTDVDLAGVTRVLIDLTGLSFCDSTGFSAVARLHDDQRREQRQVHLLHPQPCFRLLAELTGRRDLIPA
jgi:anti-anti-sigma factor